MPPPSTQPAIVLNRSSIAAKTPVRNARRQEGGRTMRLNGAPFMRRARAPQAPDVPGALVRMHPSFACGRTARAKKRRLKAGSGDPLNRPASEERILPPLSSLSTGRFGFDDSVSHDRFQLWPGRSPLGTTDQAAAGNGFGSDRKRRSGTSRRGRLTKPPPCGRNGLAPSFCKDRQASSSSPVEPEASASRDRQRRTGRASAPKGIRTGETDRPRPARRFGGEPPELRL